MTDRLELAFFADTPADAVDQAKAWAHAEPNLRLRTIAKVRRDPANARRWIVDLAVAYIDGRSPRSPDELPLPARPASGVPDRPGGGSLASSGPLPVSGAGAGRSTTEDQP